VALHDSPFKRLVRSARTANLGGRLTDGGTHTQTARLRYARLLSSFCRREAVPFSLSRSVGAGEGPLLRRRPMMKETRERECLVFFQDEKRLEG
jgi:hypothetical protein